MLCMYVLIKIKYKYLYDLSTYILLFTQLLSKNINSFISLIYNLIWIYMENALWI